MGYTLCHNAWYTWTFYMRKSLSHHQHVIVCFTMCSECTSCKQVIFTFQSTHICEPFFRSLYWLSDHFWSNTGLFHLSPFCQWLTFQHLVCRSQFQNKRLIKYLPAILGPKNLRTLQWKNWRQTASNSVNRRI